MVKKGFYTKEPLESTRYIIGEYTYGHPKIYDWGGETNLIIGKYTSIADGVTILLGGNHRMDWVTTYPFSALADKWPEAADIKGHPWSKGDVVIGNDVWLGNGVTILSGVNIGDGAVVAARSVVVKDVEPYAVVGGNPAKEIKKRFSKKTIKELQKIQWWNWDEEKIKNNVTLLCSVDCKEFIRKHKV